MAVVNDAVASWIANSGVEVIRLDLSSRTLVSGMKGQLKKALRGAFAFCRFCWLAFSGRIGALYVGLSGGMGQLLELLFVLIASGARVQIVLHHHSFAYVDAVKWPMRAITRIGGSTALHVLLCRRMLDRFQLLYPAAQNVICISNAVWIPDAFSAGNAQRDGVATLGFLSNVSKDKGIFEFLDLVRECARSGMNVSALIAGPFTDTDTERLVRDRLGNSPNTRYLGPQFGANKTKFFEEIDVLIFPTQYKNEAEPLVVLEALAAGVPVLATNRGCMGEIIPQGAGSVVDDMSEIVASFLEQLRAWQSDPGSFRLACKAARNGYLSARQRSDLATQSLLQRLSAATDNLK